MGERWGDKRRALCNSVKITECSASYIKERFSLFFRQVLVNLPAWVSCEIHIAKIDLFRYNAFVINACVFVMKQKNACHKIEIHDKHQG